MRTKKKGIFCRFFFWPEYPCNMYVECMEYVTHTGLYHSVHYNNISFSAFVMGSFSYHRLYIIQLVSWKNNGRAAANALQMVECFTHDSFNGAAHTFFMCLKSTYTTISKGSGSHAHSSKNPSRSSSILSVSLNLVDVSALLLLLLGSCTHDAMKQQIKSLLSRRDQNKFFI